MCSTRGLPAEKLISLRPASTAALRELPACSAMSCSASRLACADSASSTLDPDTRTAYMAPAVSCVPSKEHLRGDKVHKERALPRLARLASTHSPARARALQGNVVCKVLLHRS